MRRPSKVKAGLLAAVPTLPIATVCLLAGMIPAGAAFEAAWAESLLGHGDLAVFAFLTLAVVFAIGGAFAAVLFSFLTIVDHFPFGAYRLRLVPKDDPTRKSRT